MSLVDQLDKAIKTLRQRRRPAAPAARCALCGGALAGAGQVCARCDARAQRRAAGGKARRSGGHYRSKPGKHGTLWLYRIVYRDDDLGSPTFSWNTWAYDEDHALEKWYGSDDDTGWKIVSGPTRVRESQGGKKRRGQLPTGPDYVVQILIRGRRVTWVNIAARPTFDEAHEKAQQQTDVGHAVRIVHDGEVVWPTGGKPRRATSPKVRKGIYYFATYSAAREWAQAHGWPTDRINAFEIGWAIQAGDSGSYAGPEAAPTPYTGGLPEVEKLFLPRRGGKLRHTAQDVARGAKVELEHAKTIKKIARQQLPVKQAATEIAKDHLKEDPHYYDRLDAVEVPKRRQGLKAPRLKLLMKRGRVKVYLVDSHLVRQMKGQGDWANGGHSRVFPETCPPNEVWVGSETFGPERKCYILHELLEFWRMGNGMGYDQAHDLSTAAEQHYRKRKMRGIDAAIRAALKKAAEG